VAILKESVPPARWIGIVLVMAGVILIARGGGDT
jgi:drug/metabolite transporter (DMT)-like permease